MTGETHREIARTRSYLMLSRRRGTLLFRDLLHYRKHIEELHARLEAESNLLARALHELAVTQEKEPQHFARKWLTDARKEARNVKAS